MNRCLLLLPLLLLLTALALTRATHAAEAALVCTSTAGVACKVIDGVYLLKIDIPGGDPLHLWVEIRRPLERAVQIHHMQPGRAQRLPVPGHLRRVFAIDGFRVRVPLAQTHTAPFPQIDCRINNHNAHHSITTIQPYR